MVDIFRLMLDWSEVWASMFPIAMFMVYRKQPSYMRPIVIYFCIAFCLYLVGNVISDYKKHLPSWMQSNNPIYNLHSMVRFICFSIFFIKLQQKKLDWVYKLLPLVSLLIFVLNFTLIDDFFNPRHFSGNLLAGEAYLLLIYCMLYYLYKLNEDDVELLHEPDFWVVTGLAIYVVVNFFVFLFYVPMINEDKGLALHIWDIHNYAYIALCLFISKALYDAPRYQYSV